MNDDGRRASCENQAAGAPGSCVARERARLGAFVAAVFPVAPFAGAGLTEGSGAPFTGTAFSGTDFLSDALAVVDRDDPDFATPFATVAFAGLAFAAGAFTAARFAAFAFAVEAFAAVAFAAVAFGAVDPAVRPEGFLAETGLTLALPFGLEAGVFATERSEAFFRPAGFRGFRMGVFDRPAVALILVGRAVGAAFRADNLAETRVRAAGLRAEATLAPFFRGAATFRRADFLVPEADFLEALLVDFAAVLPGARLVFLPFGIGISALH